MRTFRYLSVLLVLCLLGVTLSDAHAANVDEPINPSASYTDAEERAAARESQRLRDQLYDDDEEDDDDDEGLDDEDEQDEARAHQQVGKRSDAFDWEEEAEPGLLDLLSNPSKLLEEEKPYDVTKLSRGGRVHVSFCNS
jgi:hypothetical protein